MIFKKELNNQKKVLPLRLYQMWNGSQIFFNLALLRYFFLWKNYIDAKFFPFRQHNNIYIHKNQIPITADFRARKRSLISYKLTDVCLSVQPCTFDGKFGKDIHKNS